MPLSIEREIFQVNEIIPVDRAGEGGPHLYNEDLSFIGEDSQYSLHALHPYVAAINPPLVRRLLQTYIPAGENILDPFCGGGGVLLESTLNGTANAGGDVNPLSVILSKAKTTWVDPVLIEEAYLQIMALAVALQHEPYEAIDPQLAFWYKEESISSILALKISIEQVTANNGDLHNLFNAVFSATVRDVMLTYRGEVRLRKLQGKDLERFQPDVFKSFEKRFMIAHDRMSTLPEGARSDIQIRDIKQMDFQNESFHSIICSPPYADDKNGVGYFQFSKNMLAWLGYSKEQISECKSMFLGSSKTLNALPTSESLQISLENVSKRNATHLKEAVSFYYDYSLALSEMARVVREYIVIVIGNRVLSRTQFDNAQITVDFFQNFGIELRHHYTRELRKKRIANMGGDGGGIAKEHILVFQK